MQHTQTFLPIKENLTQEVQYAYMYTCAFHMVCYDTDIPCKRGLKLNIKYGKFLKIQNSTRAIKFDLLWIETYSLQFLS